MGVARDVVRRRIDPAGTKEITVITEGGNRILVEVPGVEDPEALKKLIGQTARLEFKLVDLSANPQDVQQGRAPPGSQVLPMADGTGFIAVKRRVMVSGDQLTDAKQSFDQDGRPDIEITFNTAGARRFGRATQENVNKPFAIILDDKVLSAPNINEPILGGSAQITGSFTVQSAHDLAVSLASGKLPVKLNVIEERTVSAELGQDFDPQGRDRHRSCRILGVIIFMLVTYGRFGVYANIALVVNAFLILGIMAMFNATLTLPGIAGFILTIGAAVDANVLINERIREEIAARAAADRCGRDRLSRSVPGDFRRQRHPRHLGGDHGLFRLGPGARLRRRAADRRRHLGVHRRLFHPHAGGAVDPPRAPARDCIFKAAVDEAAQARPRPHQPRLHALAQPRAGAVADRDRRLDRLHRLSRPQPRHRLRRRAGGPGRVRASRCTIEELRARVDQLGVGEASIQALGNDRTYQIRLPKPPGPETRVERGGQQAPHGDPAALSRRARRRRRIGFGQGQRGACAGQRQGDRASR